MATLRDRLGDLETKASSSRQGSSGVEVVLPSDPATPAPLCPHGGSVSGLSLAVGPLEAWITFQPLYPTVCDA